jgi:CSLREA domain-containing protein
MSHPFATLFSNINFNFKTRISHIKLATPRVNIRQAATLCLIALCLCAGLILSAHVAADSAMQQRGKAKPAVVTDTFIVTKIADTNDGVCDADCSLREAIAAANVDAGASNITFALPPDSTITLSNGELTINSNLTIDGTSSPRLIVDANNTSRVFVVNAGVEATIANLTATKGHDIRFVSSGGGGIFNAGTLTLTNVTVSNSTATLGNGGGILNSGTLNMANSTLNNNAGGGDRGGGGGIYNTGTLNITNSTFSVNRAGDTGNSGGGIYNAGGNATVVNSTFRINSTWSDGGGIYNTIGTLIVAGSTFDGNTSRYSGGSGISNYQGTLNVSNSTFLNNFAERGSGGGISSNSYNNIGKLTITDSSFNNNRTNDGDGGGLYTSGTASLSNSTFSNNSSNFGGGAILAGGMLTITNSTISNNVGGGSGGSGIYSVGTLNLIGSTVNNNMGAYGGIYNTGTMNVSNSTVSNNTGDLYGGAFTNQGTLSITSSTISNNTASGRNGPGCGGIYNFTYATHIVNINNTIVANNSGTLSADVYGTFNSQGHNLIGIVNGGTGFTASGDQVGTASSPIDPLLGPLQNNGGVTQTRALLPGSPAIDKGQTTLTTDQRGVPRPQGTSSDIGAFELESNVTPIFVAVNGTITFEGHGLAGVTVTLSGDANATTTTDANGFYFFTNLNGGTYTVSVSKPDFTFTPASRNVVSNGRNQAADFVATSTLNNGQPDNGRLLISEFRLQGPIPTSTPILSGNEQGQLDEFIELYNNTDAPQNITGYKIETSTGFSISLPVGVIMPPHGHFLIVNAGYGLNGYATSDLSYQGFDLEPTTGLALLDSSSNVLDAVGFTGSPAPFREGAGLPEAFSLLSGEYSYVRKLVSTWPQDTGDNSADFIVVSTTASNSVILGAPGPENFSSPIVKTPSQMPGNYIDPMACGSCPPNRVIEGTNPRLLKIRRTYTNLTGSDITRLRFRIIDLTTLHNQASGEADLRVVSSNAEVINLLSGSTKTANALTLEEPPNQTTQQGGGINSTITDNTITFATPLASNATVSVNYWLRIVAGGRFRFFVNIEALP